VQKLQNNWAVCAHHYSVDESKLLIIFNCWRMYKCEIIAIIGKKRVRLW